MSCWDSALLSWESMRFMQESRRDFVTSTELFCQTMLWRQQSMILGLQGRRSLSTAASDKHFYSHTRQWKLLCPATYGIITGPVISVPLNLTFCHITAWFVTWGDHQDYRKEYFPTWDVCYWFWMMYNLPSSPFLSLLQKILVFVY